MKAKRQKKSAPSAQVAKQANARIRTVWGDLCDTPGDAGTKLLRSTLTIVLEDHIKAHRWSKAIAAKRCGVSPAQIELLRRGSVSHLTADNLAAMIHTAGLDTLVKLAEYLLRERTPQKKRRRRTADGH